MTVTLVRAGADTEVILHHANVPDDEMGRMHAEGWSDVLGAIADRFAKR